MECEPFQKIADLPEAVKVLMDWCQLSAADFDEKYPDKRDWSRDDLFEWLKDQL